MALHLEVHCGFVAGWGPIFIFEIPRRIPSGFCRVRVLDNWIDYSRFEIGLSEKRANWLIKFVENLQGDGWLTGVRQFQEFHGRLGFASQMLRWLKPLLGPGYAWLSAVAKATTLKVPELLAITCIFIKEKFSSGLRKLPCGCREEHIGEIFRTDTKCADGRVILGGWRTDFTPTSKSAPWFSLEIGVYEAPWLFRGPERSSSWASTSVEMLASVVALQVFGIGVDPARRTSHILHCRGGQITKLRNL